MAYATRDDLANQVYSLEKRLKEEQEAFKVKQMELRTLLENYDTLKEDRDQYIKKYHNALRDIGAVKIKFRKWEKKQRQKYNELMRTHLAVIAFLTK